MNTFLSRRTFLVAAGGGVSASLVGACRGSRRDPLQTASPDGTIDRFGQYDEYVDDGGWMLAPGDKKIVRANPA